MADFSGLDAVQAIAGWFGRNGATLDETMFNLVQSGLASNGPGVFVDTMEVLYAVREDLDEEGRELLDGLTRWMTQVGFHGSRERAIALSPVAARLLAGGEAVDDADPEASPTVEPQAAPPPAPAPVPPENPA